MLADSISKRATFKTEMRKILSRLTSTNRDETIDYGRLRNRSMKAGQMLRNRQNSTKFKSLTEDDDKMPYEEMGTVLVVVFLAFLVLVQLLIIYGPDSDQEVKNCTCGNESFES